MFIVVDGLEYGGPAEECAVDAADKAACGDPNNRDLCLQQGCCWSPSLDAQEPDCYQAGKTHGCIAEE